jgi:arginine/ornithine N-succinyltransferase beta subunit
VAALRATRDSVLVTAGNAVGEQAATAPALLCTTNLEEFRAIAAAAAAAPDLAILTPAARNALQCDSACTIRVLGLQ